MQICRESPVGVSVGTLEKGNNIGLAQTKKVPLEMEYNVNMSLNATNATNDRYFEGGEHLPDSEESLKIRLSQMNEVPVDRQRTGKLTKGRLHQCQLTLSGD